MGSRPEPGEVGTVLDLEFKDTRLRQVKTAACDGRVKCQPVPVFHNQNFNDALYIAADPSPSEHDYTQSKQPG